MKQLIGLIAANYVPENITDITRGRPLAAMPFAGRYRLIDFALSNMSNMGIRSVGIIMPGNYRPILDHLGSGKEWSLDKKRGGLFIFPGVNYGYLKSGSKFPMRDIINNAEYLYRADEEYILISSANQVFNIDLEDLFKNHLASGADVTLLYKGISYEYESDEKVRFISDKDEKVTALPEVQPDTDAKLFADVMIISKELLLKLIGWYREVPYTDLLDVLEQNLRTLNVRCHAMEGYLRRIDNTNNYFEANMDLLKKEVRSELFNGSRTIYTKIRDNMPTKYETGCSVSNSLFANGCVISGNVKNSILSRGVIIEPGASIKNCILLQKTIVRSGAILENVIADKYSEISKGTILIKEDGSPYYLHKMANI